MSDTNVRLNAVESLVGTVNCKPPHECTLVGKVAISNVQTWNKGTVGGKIGVLAYAFARVGQEKSMTNLVRQSVNKNLAGSIIIHKYRTGPDISYKAERRNKCMIQLISYVCWWILLRWGYNGEGKVD